MQVIRETWQKAKHPMRVMVDILFPPQCMACGALVGQAQALCAGCFAQIRWIHDPLCQCCGIPLPYAVGGDVQCADCLNDPPHFAHVRAAMVYDAASSALVTNLKYRDATQQVSGLVAMMLRAGAEILPRAEIIVPVPLHWKRHVRRKYNQAALLAYMLADKVRLPMLPDALERVQHTPPQAGLPRKERLKNVQHAFAVKHADAVAGKSVLLVDDVVTTGATVEACSRVLLSAGAREVHVLALARTVLE